MDCPFNYVNCVVVDPKLDSWRTLQINDLDFYFSCYKCLVLMCILYLHYRINFSLFITFLFEIFIFLFSRFLIRHKKISLDKYFLYPIWEGKSKRIINIL